MLTAKTVDFDMIRFSGVNVTTSEIRQKVSAFEAFYGLPAEKIMLYGTYEGVEGGLVFADNGILLVDVGKRGGWLIIKDNRGDTYRVTPYNPDSTRNKAIEFHLS